MLTTITRMEGKIKKFILLFLLVLTPSLTISAQKVKTKVLKSLERGTITQHFFIVKLGNGFVDASQFTFTKQVRGDGTTTYFWEYQNSGSSINSDNTDTIIVSTGSEMIKKNFTLSTQYTSGRVIGDTYFPPNYGFTGSMVLSEDELDTFIEATQLMFQKEAGSSLGKIYEFNDKKLKSLKKAFITLKAK